MSAYSDERLVGRALVVDRRVGPRRRKWGVGPRRRQGVGHRRRKGVGPRRRQGGPTSS